MRDGEQDKNEPVSLVHAYQLAVLEFNCAAVPLIVALAAEIPPSASEVALEEAARAAVVAARSKVWATHQMTAQPPGRQKPKALQNVWPLRGPH